MTDRKILHLDLDAFFCSVEELLDPTLIGKAFAVGGNPQGRGVIVSASYAARKFGVRSAMPSGRALKLCPNLVFVRSKHSLYSNFSNKVMDILHDISPLVQQISVDEAFIDVTDIQKPIESICHDLQNRVDRETNLPISIGAGTSKMIAKIANNIGKSQVKTGKSPRSINIVKVGDEANFLAPLDIQEMWGIGPKSAERLRSRGFKTIGDLANADISDLIEYFGKNAELMKNRALGIDHSPVHTLREAKSISNEITFDEDSDDIDFLKNIIMQLSDKVAWRLRKENLAGKVISIKIRYSDFSTFTRQKALANPTNVGDEIFETSYALFLENVNHNRAIRLIGVGVSHLEEPFTQLELFGDNIQKKQDLVQAVDSLRDKFGKDVIIRANQLKKNK
jgi:DNA polymerase-4